MSMVDMHTCVSLSILSLFPNLWYGQILWNVPIDFVHLIPRVPSLIFESFLFILIADAVQFIQMRMEGGISSMPLLTVFVRDGTWAFMLTFGEWRVMFFTNPLTLPW